MELPSATGYTHSDNVSGSYPFERSDFRVEESRPAYYGQHSAHPCDSSADEYHGSQFQAVTVEYSGAGYLHSDRNNCVYALQQQVNYNEESIPAFSGETSLQSPGIIPDIMDIIPSLYDASRIGQHSAPRNSNLEHSNYTCSSDHQYISNETNILSFSGQHSLKSTAVAPDVYHVSQSMLTTEHHSAAQCSYLQPISEACDSLQTNSSTEKNISALPGLSDVFPTCMIQDIHPLHHTVLPSVQHPFALERIDEMTDYKPHSSNCNNINSNEQQRIYSHFKHNASKNVKGLTAMKENEKIPSFATGMQLYYGSEIKNKNSSNSPSNTLSLSDHQGRNFNDKLQHVNGTFTSSHTHTFYGDEQVIGEEGRIYASLMEGIQQGKIVINESENIFFCRICNRSLPTRNPRPHWEKFHVEKCFECRTCGKRFGTLSILDSHKIVHSIKRYACNKCKFRAVSKGNLNKHMKAHSRTVLYVANVHGRSDGNAVLIVI